MFHLSYSLEEGELSEAVCCENRRFSTVLKLQIVLASLLVAFAAALFCLPAKNAYALDDLETELEVTTIGNATYSYLTWTYEGEEYAEIRKIESKSPSVTVPDKIGNAYVNTIAEHYDGQGSCEISPLITSLDISNCSRLKIFIAWRSNLASLNVSGNTYIQHIECTDGNLASINVSGCSNLRFLLCRDNNLSSLNISGLTTLEDLYCYNNRISNIAALEAWLSEDGHDGQVLPQKATDNPGNTGNTGNGGNDGNTGNSGNAGNAGNTGDNNNPPATITGAWKHNSKGWW